MKQRAKPARKSTRGDVLIPNQDQVPRAIHFVQREARTYRRILGNQGYVTTAASGYVGLKAICGSDTVVLCADWAACVTTALEYRVLGIEVNFFPIYSDVPASTTLTAPPPAMYMLCAFSGGYVPSNLDQVIAGPGAKACWGLRPFKFSASAKGNKDAMLWTATSTTITSAEKYGVYLTDQAYAPAGPVTGVVLRYCVRYLVEFRSLD